MNVDIRGMSFAEIAKDWKMPKNPRVRWDRLQSHVNTCSPKALDAGLTMPLDSNDLTLFLFTYVEYNNLPTTMAITEARQRKSSRP